MEELKFRNELKYNINYKDYEMMRPVLRSFMKVDGNALNNTDSYHIRSLYFDDFCNTALYEKLSGCDCRSKYRVRIYNMSDRLIMLEKKIKKGNRTAKIRQELTKEECSKILENDYDSFIASDKSLLKELFIKNRSDLLKPVVIVDYEREAYISPLGNVRITFDKWLKTGLFSTDLFNAGLPMLKALDEEVIVMEVKYDEYLPLHIKNAVQIKNRQRLSVSKYVICRKHNKINSWEDN